MHNLESQEVEYCQLKINYKADPSVVSEKRNEAVKQLKNAPVPGFRPNKAPEHAIAAKYRDHINDWVKREMISAAYDDSLFELKFKPIGYPKTLSMKLDGNDFNCELLFLKKPEFKLCDVKAIEVPKPHIPTT